MKKDYEPLYRMMVDKCQESFLLAIELYNKPTINYRAEGFCFFICNAWELLLKAYLLKNGKSIKYEDKNNRTLSLSAVIDKIMTNKNDPVRKNLEAVNGVRNMCTHLVIPEYAALFNDVFMACVKNFTIKLKEYLNVTIDEKLCSDYLTMFIPRENSKVDIEGKYGKEVFEKYIKTRSFLTHSYVENSNDKNIVNDHFAISYELSLKTTKDINAADFTVSKVSPKSSQFGVIKVVEKADPNKTHPYSCKQLVLAVRKEMTLRNITFSPVSANAKKEFTTSTFNLLNKKFRFKQEKEYTFEHKVGNNVQYSYSTKLVARIIDIFTNDSEILLK